MGLYHNSSRCLTVPPSVVLIPHFDLSVHRNYIVYYTLTQSDLLPSVPREEGKPTNSKDLCSYWHKIGQMKTLEGKSRFGNIANLAKCLLSLPHFNADTERIFSIALLACKVNNDNCYYDTDVPKELVKIAKQATMNYNRAHSSKFTYSQIHQIKTI